MYFSWINYVPVSSQCFKNTLIHQMQVRYTARYFKNMKKKTGSLYPESKTQMAFFPEIDIFRFGV
jgi:hypothetical protein